MSIWMPVLILGLGGTASLIRTMRAHTLDELHKPKDEYLDAGAHPWIGRHSQPDPHHACEHARRTAQTLRHDGSGERPEEEPSDLEIPGARGAQSLCVECWP